MEGNNEGLSLTNTTHQEPDNGNIMNNIAFYFHARFWRSSVIVDRMKMRACYIESSKQSTVERLITGCWYICQFILCLTFFH